MRILLLGYGKMGKTIEQICLQRGHHIAGIIDATDDQRDSYSNENVDAAIEFSQPDAAVANILWCIERNIPVISGTTGWLDQWDEVTNKVKSANGTLFYASNYSIGVNIFFRLNRQLASMMDHFENYDMAMEEIHHTEKMDSPSGTAITLAKGILAELKRKKSWTEENGSSEQILIRSFREPDVPGTHMIKYVSEEDTLEIKHTAHSRKGFANGAVQVAEWIKGKKGILGMDDFLDF